MWESANHQKKGAYMNKLTLIDILPEGKDNAIDWKVLVRLLGLNERRTLYKVIENERHLHEDEGLIILPDNHGAYYIANPDNPEDYEEIRTFYKRMCHVGIRTLSSVKACGRCIRKHEEEEARKNQIHFNISGKKE